eukprot:950891-Amphidinium_carterae.1
MHRESSRDTPASHGVGKRISAKVFGSVTTVTTEGDEIKSRGSHKNRSRPAPNRLQKQQSYVLEGEAVLMAACRSKSSKDSMNTADGGAVM